MPFGGPLVRKLKLDPLGPYASLADTWEPILSFAAPRVTTRAIGSCLRTPRGQRFLLDQLHCMEPTVGSRFHSLSPSMKKFSEAHVKEFAARWIWDDLTCSVGHVIQAPKWLSEPGPHRELSI